MSDVAYIAHHGIKGQKWGVRRFQNKDGSYTDEGKRRRGGFLSKVRDKGRNVVPSKRYSKMTDAEIEQRIKRKQNEVRLADLEFESSVPAGVRYVKSFAKSGFSKGMTAVVAGVTFAVGKKYIEDKYGFSIPKMGK